eukprot:TRINITY_DN76077_c0_g1_i1.p1 TRINITY_DN76077_c0_g1~~TRINITY_DN76077_c0_g1_i1.p1  ORF type:complete len:431 (-),score=38.52 TRINITY_DN76077_c0_g1_i1:206-1498(-)
MKIIIIGAGVSGLALANLIKDDGHDIEIYEREATPEARKYSGWSFSIRNDRGLKGQETLKRIGVWDKCLNKLGGPCHKFTLLTPKGTTVTTLSAAPGDTHTLRIHRGELRQALLDCLAESSTPIPVHWDAHCTGYRTEGSSAVVFFKDGSEARGDLVIAADGLRSPIRTQLVGDEVIGRNVITVMAMGPTNIATPLTDKSIFMTVGNGVTFFYANVHYRDEQNSNWGLITKVTPEEFAEVRESRRWEGCSEGTPELKQKVLDLVRQKKLHQPIEELVQEIPASQLAIWSAYDRNPTTNWRDGRVVLMGDAAHAMTPFAGAGANCALMDALVLSETLKKASIEQPDGPTFEGWLDDYVKARAKSANGFLMEARGNGDALVAEGWPGVLKIYVPFWFIGKIFGTSTKQKVGWLGTAVAGAAVAWGAYRALKK